MKDKKENFVTEKDILALCSDLKVIVDGHFAYTSNGKHGYQYINKDALYLYAQDTSRLCLEMAKRAFLLCPDIDCVVGPEKGGIILSQWMGYHLSQKKQRPVLSIFAEKRLRTRAAVESDDNRDFDFIFTRGYGKEVESKNVWIVEDVINRGRSVKKLVALVQESGGKVQGVSALWNRGNVRAEDIGCPPNFFALLNIPLLSFDKKYCYLCKDGILIDEQLGRGRK